MLNQYTAVKYTDVALDSKRHTKQYANKKEEVDNLYVYGARSVCVFTCEW
jgi:hypothetical protein